MKNGKHGAAKNRPIYRKLPGARISDATANIVATEMNRLVVRLGRPITAHDVVVAARARGSKLHSLFDWDDRRAAEKYRLWQARELLGSVEVEYRKVRGPAFVNLQDGEGYRPASVVYESQDMSGQFLELAKRDLLAWYHRWQRVRDIAALRGVFVAVDSVIEDLKSDGNAKQGKAA